MQRRTFVRPPHHNVHHLGQERKCAAHPLTRRQHVHSPPPFFRPHAALAVICMFTMELLHTRSLSNKLPLPPSRARQARGKLSRILARNKFYANNVHTVAHTIYIYKTLSSPRRENTFEPQTTWGAHRTHGHKKTQYQQSGTVKNARKSFPTTDHLFCWLAWTMCGGVRWFFARLLLPVWGCCCSGMRVCIAICLLDGFLVVVFSPTFDDSIWKLKR